MKIEFNAEGEKVSVKINHGGDVSGYYTELTWDFGSKFTASMAAAHARRDLRNTIERIKRQAYEQGYADKTKRRPKQDYFSGEM